MNILIIGGMHGNEPLGLEVVKLFQEKPVKGIEVVFANEQAIAGNCRFVGQDLNRSFPGKVKGKTYEEHRAVKLLKLSRKYDLVLDFHNTYCSSNDCGFVGEQANQVLYNVAWLLGLKRLVVADYDCINKFASNCLSVEVSLDSKLNYAELWYERILILSKLISYVVEPAIDLYRFAYRITLEDRDRLNLDEQNLQAFKPISNKLAKALNVTSPAYPIFVKDKYTPYNYGGLINKINV